MHCIGITVPQHFNESLSLFDSLRLQWMIRRGLAVMVRYAGTSLVF